MFFRMFLGVLAGAQFLAALPISPCVTDTLANYLTLSPAGCVTTSGLELMDFGFLGMPATLAINSAQITVTPLSNGLRFSSNFFQVSGGQSLAFLISYDVDPDELVTVEQTMTVGPGGVQSPASVLITKNLCLGQPFSMPNSCPGLSASVRVFDNGIIATLNNSVSFAPTSFIGVQEIVQVNATNSTCATPCVVFQSFDNKFNTSATPEPVTFLLCSLGVFAMIRSRRSFLRPKTID